jgi:hypothetical protein
MRILSAMVAAATLIGASFLAPAPAEAMPVQSNIAEPGQTSAVEQVGYYYGYRYHRYRHHHFYYRPIYHRRYYRIHYYRPHYYRPYYYRPHYYHPYYHHRYRYGY